MGVPAAARARTMLAARTTFTRLVTRSGNVEVLDHCESPVSAAARTADANAAAHAFRDDGRAVHCHADWFDFDALQFETPTPPPRPSLGNASAASARTTPEKPAVCGASPLRALLPTSDAADPHAVPSVRNPSAPGQEHAPPGSSFIPEIHPCNPVPWTPRESVLLCVCVSVCMCVCACVCVCVESWRQLHDKLAVSKGSH